MRSRACFSPALHSTGADVKFGKDLQWSPYATIRLPSAKTSSIGSSGQSICLAQQEPALDPLAALNHHLLLNKPTVSDHLFSWRDSAGRARPLTRRAMNDRLSAILTAAGGGKFFGHSLRIGGASFFLSRGVSPEIVKLLGRWKSITYEVYVRALKLIAPQHLEMRTLA